MVLWESSQRQRSVMVSCPDDGDYDDDDDDDDHKAEQV